MILLSDLAGGGKRVNGGAAYRRPPFFRTKKLGLLGATPSLEFAPWHDPQWTLAAHPCCRPKCQREPDWYFDMHRPECFRVERKTWNHQYYAWLKNLQTPIFMQEHWPDIPLSVRYPKERVFAEYRAYFTNHCAYMIALAMTEGVTHIGLFGCQYAGAERGTQRDSLTYWMGRFEQAGGTLVIPEKGNSLLTKELYGYESHDDQGKLIPSYRVQPVIEQQGKSPLVLQEPSTVPLAPRPAGEAPRSFADAFPDVAVRRGGDSPCAGDVDDARPTVAVARESMARAIQNPISECVEA